MYKWQHSIVTLMTLLILTSCATLLPTTNSQKNLENRVAELMSAKVSGDWATVYDYFNQDYRNEIEKSNFTNRNRIIFTEYTIESIVINQKNNATVHVTTSFMSNGFTFNDAPSKQTWLYENGNWYQQVMPHAEKSMFGK